MANTFSGLPAPSYYPKWQDWAVALMTELQKAQMPSVTDPVIDKITTPFVLAGNVQGTTLTSVYSKVVKAGQLGTTGIARCRLRGHWLNSGTTGALAVQISFGGTVIWKSLTASQSHANPMPFLLDFELANLGSASVQAVNGWALLSNETAATVGAAAFGLTSVVRNIAGLANRAAINSGSDQTFDISMQLPNTEATDVFTLDYLTLELL